MRYGSFPGQRILSAQNIFKSHRIHTRNIVRKGKYPNICDLKSSCHITGCRSRCLKASINYTQDFYLYLSPPMFSHRPPSFDKTTLGDSGSHAHDTERSFCGHEIGVVYLWVPRYMHAGSALTFAGTCRDWRSTLECLPRFFCTLFIFKT